MQTKTFYKLHVFQVFWLDIICPSSQQPVINKKYKEVINEAELHLTAKKTHLHESQQRRTNAVSHTCPAVSTS